MSKKKIKIVIHSKKCPHCSMNRNVPFSCGGVGAERRPSVARLKTSPPRLHFARGDRRDEKTSSRLVASPPSWAVPLFLRAGRSGNAQLHSLAHGPGALQAAWSHPATDTPAPSSSPGASSAPPIPIGTIGSSTPPSNHSVPRDPLESTAPPADPFPWASGDDHREHCLRLLHELQVLLGRETALKQAIGRDHVVDLLQAASL